VLLGDVTRDITRETQCPVVVLTRGDEHRLQSIIAAPESAAA
jgi:hypothetical protein